MAAETKENKFTYHLLDVADKCLVLKLDLNVSFADACEVIAIFSSSKRPFAEKLIKDLNKGN